MKTRIWALPLLCLLVSVDAFSQTPQISGVTDAANFGKTAAPGSLISVFGTNLATGTKQASSYPLPTNLLGTMVYINGIAAPLTYVSAGQINAQVPYSIPTGSSASVLVQVNGANSANAYINVAAAAPAIFTQTGTGTGAAAVLNTNYSIVTSANAADPGQTVEIFATGLGATSPAVQTGAAGNGQTLMQTVTVTIGGQNATVSFAGAAPGFAGLDQINAVVPDVSAGNQPIVISEGGAQSSSTITIAIGVSGGSSSGAIQSTYFGMELRQGYLEGNLPWPTIPFGTIRLLADNVSWADIEPTQGTFNFTLLDSVVAGAQKHGITALLYTLTKTPAWASSNTTTPGCADYLNRMGGCYPPSDLNADGTGADQYWKDYVTAVVQHECTPGPCNVQSWEIWNEPNAENFWRGTTQQLVRMTEDANQIIKGVNPDLLIVSPPPAGGGNPDSTAASFLQGFFADGGSQYVDVIGFHGYLLPAQVQAGQVELLLSGLSDLESTRSSAGLTSKPLWDTEGSWGLTTNLPDVDMEAAFVARYYLLQATYVQRFYWFAYDDPSGTLYDDTTMMLLEPGVAYGQVYNWLVGATPSGPCTNNGSIYMCGFTRPGGYQALAVWDSSLSCSNGACTTTSYTAPSGYTQYADLAGNVTPITGGTIQISVKPILLENGNP
jgi:uncharacterized protein (TIGR03437 family)